MWGLGFGLDRGINMQFENYTERTRGFVQLAQTLAIKSNHQQLTPLHLLKILLEDPEGLAIDLIEAAGGDSVRALEAARLEMNKLPKVDGSGAGQAHLAPDTARLFEQSEKLAKKNEDTYVSAEVLLLAIAMAAGTTAEMVLKNASVTPQALNRAIKDHRKGRKADSASAENSYDSLKKYKEAISDNSNLPNSLLSEAISLSP